LALAHLFTTRPGLTEAGKNRLHNRTGMTSDRPDAGKEVVLAFQHLLRAMRAEVEGMDEAALGWTPAADTTPISNLVLHVLGAMSVHLSVLAGAPQERDRDAEFSAAPLPAGQLADRIAAAERDVERLRDSLSEAALYSRRERPARGQSASGLLVLLVAHGHLSEHLAQIRLTRQLYAERHANPVGRPP
jgi:hypothetical protein